MGQASSAIRPAQDTTAVQAERDRHLNQASDSDIRSVSDRAHAMISEANANAEEAKLGGIDSRIKGLEKKIENEKAHPSKMESSGKGGMKYTVDEGKISEWQAEIDKLQQERTEAQSKVIEAQNRSRTHNDSANFEEATASTERSQANGLNAELTTAQAAQTRAEQEANETQVTPPKTSEFIDTLAVKEAESNFAVEKYKADVDKLGEIVNNLQSTNSPEAADLRIMQNMTRAKEGFWAVQNDQDKELKELLIKNPNVFDNKPEEALMFQTLLKDRERLQDTYDSLLGSNGDGTTKAKEDVNTISQQNYAQLHTLASGGSVADADRIVGR